jgi:hypothetical protein
MMTPIRHTQIRNMMIVSKLMNGTLLAMSTNKDGLIARTNRQTLT